MSQDAKLRSTILLGLLVSVPAFRTYADHGIDVASLAIRVAVAMVVAYVAVSAVASLLAAYASKEGPPVEEDATGDEVELEDGVVADRPEEA